jgi:hypothetical protein
MAYPTFEKHPTMDLSNPLNSIVTLFLPTKLETHDLSPLLCAASGAGPLAATADATFLA